MYGTRFIKKSKGKTSIEIVSYDHWVCFRILVTPAHRLPEL